VIVVGRSIWLPAMLLAGTLSAGAQDNSPQTLKPMARDADPAFEVATIKPADPDDRNQGFGLAGHRISIESMSMTGLICFAFSIQKSQIVDAPKWFDEQRWDINGIPDADGKPNWHQYRRMLQKLLSARFGLKMHPDKRELSVYSLTVVKGGPKLEKTRSDPDALSDSSGHGVGAQQYMKFTGVSMTDFVQTLELMVDKPVIDQTNLTGRFDFTLLWTPDVLRAAEPDTAPGLFTAVQEQLGLKLEATRAQTDVLVIDFAEPPSAN
jgi:uncharacterized protein (TIGR03435 family)